MRNLNAKRREYSRLLEICLDDVARQIDAVESRLQTMTGAEYSTATARIKRDMFRLATFTTTTTTTPFQNRTAYMRF